MSRTTVFHSNRTQAVRLSKDVAFPDNVTEVAILRDGNRRVIVPANSIWDDFFDAPGIDLGAHNPPVSQDTVPQNPVTQDPMTPTPETQDDETQVLAGLALATLASAAQDPEMQDPAAQDGLAQDGEEF